MYWDIGQFLGSFLSSLVVGIVLIELFNSAKQFTQDNEVYDFALQPLYDKLFGINSITDSDSLSGLLCVFGALIPLTGIAIWPVYIIGFSLYYGLNHIRDIERLKKELNSK